MTSLALIDRHAFASNASAFNTAWETFGWTPAIEGARAGRLEEQVPWATSAARADDPPWLSGPAEQVLAPENYDRLGSGFLPLDRRLGFSVWGAIGDRARRGAEWRVLTHTLLIEENDFDLIAGFPQGLLTIGAASTWFREMVAADSFSEPRVLEPVRLSRTRATRSAFERARRDEIRRIRDQLAVVFGGESLEDALAAVLEGLARARSGGPIRHVALRSTPDRRNERLIRLAWLALPLADRAETWFLTEQRRTETPRATLFALPPSEWGEFVPQATQLVDGARRTPVSEGRRRWAHSIAQPDGSADHERLSARAEIRGWRVVARDDIAGADRTATWRSRWREAAGDARLALARELLAMQAHPEQRPGRPRLRAAGHVAALSVRGRPDAATILAGLLADFPHVGSALVASAIRTLRRGDTAARAAALRLRCEVATTAVPPGSSDELFRLLERERDLLPVAARDAAAAHALLRAAADAGFRGHAAAATLIEAALPGIPRLEDALLELACARPLSDPRAARLVTQTIAAALERRPQDVPLVRLLEEALMPALETGADAAVEAFVTSERVLEAVTAPGSEVDPARLFAATRAPAVLAAMLRNRPPASDPTGWAHLLDRTPAGALVEESVLDLLLDHFTGSAEPAARRRNRPRRGAEPSPLTKLIVTLLVGMGGRLPSEGQAERLLRLLWLERGTGGDAARTFVEADPQRGLPVIAALLVAPAPLPLFLQLRGLLLEHASALRDATAIGPLVPALEAYCPALAERVARVTRAQPRRREVRWTPSV